MKLSVPHFKQAKGSSDCGPACAQMILTYYKINKTLAEIKKSLTVTETGISTYQLGSHFLSEGFQATITTKNPFIFSTVERASSQKSILSKLKRLVKDPVLKGQRKQIVYMIAFMQEGGFVNVAVPSVDHIKSSIDAKNPLVALCTT